MMLVRVGKSLILVTVVITSILVLSSIRTIPVSLNTVAREYAVGSKDEVIYIILGSSLTIMSLLLIFLAVKGRSVNVELPDAKVLAGPTRMGEEDIKIGSGASLGKALHLSDATPGGFGPQKKNENWRVESSLVGSTLRMYWSLLCRRHNAVGLREIQRQLGFSSPSSAVYQLDKLMNLGLVRKDNMGDYSVRRVFKVGFLRDFVFIRGYPLPKSALFGALILLIDVTCFAILISIQIQIVVSLLAMSPGLISSSIFWYDALRAFKYKQRLIGRNASRHD